jgi:uncharacterized protein
MDFFARTSLSLAEITPAVVERATQIRAASGIKTPDAIHVATAIEERADLFLTGDADLARCPGIQFELI